MSAFHTLNKCIIWRNRERIRLHFGRSFLHTKLNAMRQEEKTSDNDVAREDAFCGPKMSNNGNSANERGDAFFSSMFTTFKFNVMPFIVSNLEFIYSWTLFSDSFFSLVKCRLNGLSYQFASLIHTIYVHYAFVV